MEVHGLQLSRLGVQVSIVGLMLTIPCLKGIVRQSLHTYLSGSHSILLHRGPSCLNLLVIST